MCSSIKFLALLVFLIGSGIMQTLIASANRDVIGSAAPNPTLLNDKASPLPPYHAPYSYFDVHGLISPCWPFITGRDSDPSPKCCASTKKLAELTHTRRDEQELCKCIKIIIGDHEPHEIKQLPVLGEQCNINFYIPPINGNTDCSLIV
ncbi:hypothetical protein HRI_003820700 [Hibiscus trionum]|uniref:Bifunctional inhibitor/plant lipid transfer protein/seed storage helical domain-containing protein n=1 Tax=Hibiscus trionum TaxID=183268 RepID=A0A9W7ISZ0_HIBTR|nr:hypothetical protein HRI_003820700 [Hibiscus trionum]